MKNKWNKRLHTPSLYLLQDSEAREERHSYLYIYRRMCNVSLIGKYLGDMLDPHMTYHQDPQSLVIILIPMIRCHMTLM